MARTFSSSSSSRAWCCLEQFGRQAAIGPGDCVLMDSASPLALHFEGRFSDHLSVHLPRQLLVSDKDAPVEIARRLGAEDPMSAMLRALVAKLSLTSVEYGARRNCGNCCSTPPVVSLCPGRRSTTSSHRMKTPAAGSKSRNC